MGSDPPQTKPPLDYQGPFAEDVYHERSPGLKRIFTLSGDRLIIEGKRRLQSDFQLPIALRHVDPHYGTVRRRSELAGPGALILGSMFAALFVFGLYHGGPKFLPIGATIDAGVAILCFITGIRNIRKIEYYSFRNPGGGVVFDIGRSGPDRDRFDQFVRRVIERIRSLQ